MNTTPLPFRTVFSFPGLPTAAARTCIALIVILLASMFRAEAANAQGLFIIDDGSRPRAYATAHEYARIKFFGNTFQAVLLDGKSFSGLTRQLAIHLDYSTVSAELLSNMESVARSNSNAAALLKPRMASLRNALANPLPLPAAVGHSGEPSIPTVTFGGRAFTNVKPRRISGGFLSFIHEGGAGSVPVGSLTLKTLQEMGSVNAVLRDSPGYKEATASYIPVLIVGGNAYTGVKLLAETDGKLTLTTDAGPITCNVTDVISNRRADLMKTRREAPKAVPPPVTVPALRPALAQSESQPRAINPAASMPPSIPTDDGADALPLLNKTAEPGAEELKASFEKHRTAAESGDVPAMAKLGFCYFAAEGVAQDDAKALMWFQKGAAAGDARALLGMGRCHEVECGVKRDMVKAVAFYEKAVSAGDGPAHFYLGMCHAEARGVPRNVRRAAE